MPLIRFVKHAKLTDWYEKQRERFKIHFNHNYFLRNLPYISIYNPLINQNYINPGKKH